MALVEDRKINGSFGDYLFDNVLILKSASSDATNSAWELLNEMAGDFDGTPLAAYWRNIELLKGSFALGGAVAAQNLVVGTAELPVAFVDHIEDTSRKMGESGLKVFVAGSALFLWDLGVGIKDSIAGSARTFGRTLNQLEAGEIDQYACVRAWGEATTTIVAAVYGAKGLYGLAKTVVKKARVIGTAMADVANNGGGPGMSPARVLAGGGIETWPMVRTAVGGSKGAGTAVLMAAGSKDGQTPEKINFRELGTDRLVEYAETRSTELNGLREGRDPPGWPRSKEAYPSDFQNVIAAVKELARRAALRERNVKARQALIELAPKNPQATGALLELAGGEGGGWAKGAIDKLDTTTLERLAAEEPVVHQGWRGGGRELEYVGALDVLIDMVRDQRHARALDALCRLVEEKGNLWAALEFDRLLTFDLEMVRSRASALNLRSLRSLAEFDVTTMTILERFKRVGNTEAVELLRTLNPKRWIAKAIRGEWDEYSVFNKLIEAGNEGMKTFKVDRFLDGGVTTNKVMTLSFLKRAGNTAAAELLRTLPPEAVVGDFIATGKSVVSYSRRAIEILAEAGNEGLKPYRESLQALGYNIP